jgi:hypothetical protein
MTSNMSDYSNGEITIGGVLPAEHLDEFIQLIIDDCLGPDYHNSFNEGETVEVRKYIEEAVENGERLRLCGHDLAGGEAYGLQEKLQEWGVPYVASWEPGGEYGAGVKTWRPGMGDYDSTWADEDGNALVSLYNLRQYLEKGQTIADVLQEFEIFDPRTLPPLKIAGSLGRLALALIKA